jgi:hypothetical protein
MQQYELDFSYLTGLTLNKILYDKGYNDQIFFFTSGGTFVLRNNQECCESVSISDVVGNPDDLRDVFITEAESVSSTEEETENSSCMCTFYKIVTPQGDLTISWFGQSNGYYSEAVSFYNFDTLGEELPASVQEFNTWTL